MVLAFFTFSANASINNKNIQDVWLDYRAEDLSVLEKIEKLVEKKEHEKAFELARTAKITKRDSEGKEYALNFSFYDSVMNVILWKKYSDEDIAKDVSFDDISRFVMDNPYYPNIDNIKNNAEKIAAMHDIPYSVSKQYYDKNIPISLDAKLHLLKSKIVYLETLRPYSHDFIIQKEDISSMIEDIWIEEDFDNEGEVEFLSRYKTYLDESDHINRIDRLLWDLKVDDASRIMNLVSDDYQKLFKAIININEMPNYINNIILSVPKHLRDNEGLLYKKAYWLKNKDKEKEIVDLLIALPEKVQFPQKWWKLRHLYVREMLKKGKNKLAYYLVKNHNLATTDKDFWEAEWTAGWISLRFVDKPVEAFRRFNNLYNNVVQPVTLSRASYWSAMAAEAMGDKDIALKWYKTAIKYPIFFYGQLAIHKHRVLDPFGSRNDTILPKEPEVTKYDMVRLSKIQSLQIAFILYNMSQKDYAIDIIEDLVIVSKSKTEIAAIMNFVKNLDDRSLEVTISRAASKKDVFFIRDKFQIVDEIAEDEYAPLVHAIVKQESGFAPMAVSRVGAIGYMQIMPDTAKLVARDLGVKYSQWKLSRDIKYNVRLGSFYIKKLIDRFEGSELLAIAAYNAGPHNADRWIREFYDPRKTDDIDKVVDWIELITYSETRNYVQRITENLIVYKYLMSRKNYDSVK
ncbi:MAG: lytic transglycosylase domain-containing protein [Rickettsiales bacterium]|nr:lytic transglycosylase domain-containing protein [Rickettsiales bacterium]